MTYIEDSFGLIRKIRAAKFTLTLCARERIVLPEYKGSTFRGALGWRLKQIICANRDAAECTGCMLSANCLFKRIFSPNMPKNTLFLSNTSDIPSPIIIEPPLTDKRKFDNGDTLEVGLVLIGNGIDALPYLAFAFTELGKAGIGAMLHERGGKKYGGRFELVEIKCALGGNIVYSAEGKTLYNTHKTFGWDDAVSSADGHIGDTLKINFLTPARIKELNGDGRKLATRLGSFQQIAVSLYWRLLILGYFHCNDHDVDDDRFDGLKQEAVETRKSLSEANGVLLTDNHTYWQEYDRWSNRQKTEMTLGGFMGNVDFTGKIAPYLPMLHLGAYTHIGKQTMFGLGQYIINKT